MSEIEVIKEDEIDLLDLVSVLVKNIKWIIAISLIFMVGILIYAIISLKLPADKSYLPNEFSPKTIVMLNSSGSSSGSLDSLINSSGMGALAGLAGISGGSGGVSDSALAIKLVTTNSFINKISTQFDLENVYETYESDYPKTDLRKIISEKLVIAEDKDTGMLTISYTDIDKQLATNIVNRVTSLLEEEFAKIDKIRNTDQYSVITDKMSVVEADLERLQDQIIEFQTLHNIMDVEIVAEELVKQVSEFQSELLKKEVEIESYGKVSNIRDPGYTKLINEKEAILNAISKLENGEVGDYPPVKDLPRLALELTKLKREADVKLVAYKALVQQSETLKLTAEGTGSTFQVLEYAEVPEMKSGPSRGKLVIIVTFAGFFFSIFFVFLKEAWMNIKNDPEKMKRLRGEK
ncbi:GNVR domain-containing protein [Thiospirochaeta perfilievii]|nr:GNVR domain-containing protein [Thiospirochaeta perfilievii]